MDYVLYFAGTYARISRFAVEVMLQKWFEFTGYDTPSFFIDDELKVVSISIAPGCLMKSYCSDIEDINVDLSSCRWMDSRMYNFGMLSRIDSESYALPGPLLANVKTFYHLVPFFAWDEPPRV
jgi:hypothetical protein